MDGSRVADEVVVALGEIGSKTRKIDRKVSVIEYAGGIECAGSVGIRRLCLALQVVGGVFLCSVAGFLRRALRRAGSKYGLVCLRGRVVLGVGGICEGISAAGACRRCVHERILTRDVFVRE